MDFFCQQLVRAASGEATPFDRFLIRGMLFLNATLRSNTFRGTAPVHFRVSEAAQEQVRVVARLEWLARSLGVFVSAKSSLGASLSPAFARTCTQHHASACRPDIQIRNKCMVARAGHWVSCYSSSSRGRSQ